jgi:hypothetical protein
MSNLLRSLALTTLFSFTTPIIFLGGLLLTLWVLSLLPLIAFVGQFGENQVVEFLTIFGNGCPLMGVFIIGATCGLVGGVFNLFNFCLYQNIRVRNP